MWPSAKRTPNKSEDSKMEIAYQSKTEFLQNRDRWPFGVLTGQAEGTAAVPLFIKGVLAQEEFIARLHFSHAFHP